jgi:hypothetical protein
MIAGSAAPSRQNRSDEPGCSSWSEDEAEKRRRERLEESSRRSEEFAKWWEEEKVRRKLEEEAGSGWGGETTQTYAEYNKSPVPTYLIERPRGQR